MNASNHITVLSSQSGGLLDYLRQTWNYSAVSTAIARRDLKVRYSQTFLGILWAVIQPLTGLIIFTVFFDRLIKLRVTGMPYSLFAFSGLVAWYFFSHIINNAGTSLVESQDLVRKVYFPRILVLVAKTMVGLVEFGISLILLLLLMLIQGYSLKWSFLFLPFVVLLIVSVGLSVAIWLSALTIRYRDFQHVIPYLIGFGIWLTPVFYPVTLIPPRFGWLMHWNPMAASIAGFRWSIIGGAAPEKNYLFSLIPTVTLLVGGCVYFRKVERKIADYI